MYPQDAQTSLDTIRSLQGRSIDESVDHGFARPYVLLSALVVFVTFASGDLPGPWDRYTPVLGLGLAVIVAVICQRRGRVHRKPSVLELLSYLAAAIVLLVANVAFQIATSLATLTFGMPAQHTVAAAATALTFVAAARPARMVFRAVARHAAAGTNNR